MNTSAVKRLDEKCTDLMTRAKLMRAVGYHASAEELFKRAWACAEQREAAARQSILFGGQDWMTPSSNQSNFTQRGQQ